MEFVTLMRDTYVTYVEPMLLDVLLIVEGWMFKNGFYSNVTRILFALMADRRIAFVARFLYPIVVPYLHVLRKSYTIITWILQPSRRQKYTLEKPEGLTQHCTSRRNLISNCY